MDDYRASVQQRYGIGEWYGRSLADLHEADIHRFASAGFKTIPCPFQAPGKMCNKQGGVCSFRLYQRGVSAQPEAANEAPLVSLCPNRFLEDNTIFRWVSEILIGSSSPRIVTEIPFLLSPTNDVDTQSTRGPDAVGRIDMVLINDSGSNFRWCALEIQAVYFSGPAMSGEFKRLTQATAEERLWPNRIRRPDFRSSGPKRLMPQLQIKVPTVSRWGKKMGVVIDRAFWNSLGEMTQVQHVSNCDIAWFVVDFVETGAGAFKLQPYKIFLTTLDRAVEGLTGGHPTSLEAFEEAIRRHL